MYTHVFVAGTFDRFHIGHQSVIHRALEEGKQVTIGITTDTFLHHYKAHLFEKEPFPEAFSIRKSNVESYVQSTHSESTIQYISIDDPYEPVASMSDIDALIVTPHNRETGEYINQLRTKKGHPVVQLLEVPLSPAQDGLEVSSSRIRTGTITQQGTLVLPESLRSALKEPFGTVFGKERYNEAFFHNGDQLLITVGDMTTFQAREFDILPDLSVIDLQVERKPYKTIEAFHFPEITVFKQLQSGPGFISSEVWKVLKEWLIAPTPTVFNISGEDDLVVLPLIVSVPESTVVLYGQPGEGIVRVEVTEEVKKRATALLNQFTTES